MSAHIFILQPVGSGCSQPPTYRWKCSCGAESANPYLSAAQSKTAHTGHARAASSN